MSETERPQIYLITPPEIEISSFSNTLSEVLDQNEIACIRLSLSSQDADHIQKTADALRDISHARDIPLVIDSHVQLVEKLGLDGVHLPDGARSVRKLRTELGSDAIIGAYCSTSRHEGMHAAEAGADYISFGPMSAGDLGDGSAVDLDLFQWWSEVIEVPIVAEGGLDKDTIISLSEITDFIALGPEIWTTDNPSECLKTLVSHLG